MNKKQRKDRIVELWGSLLEADSNINRLRREVLQHARHLTVKECNTLFEKHLKAITQEYYKKQPNAFDIIGKKASRTDINQGGTVRWQMNTTNWLGYFRQQAKDYTGWKRPKASPKAKLIDVPFNPDYVGPFKLWDGDELNHDTLQTALKSIKSQVPDMAWERALAAAAKVQGRMAG